MGLQEIVHRIHEQFQRKCSQYYCPDFSRSGNHRNGLPVFPYLKDAIWLQKKEKALIAQWQKLSASVKSGEIALLNVNWPTVELDSRWFIDPKTEKSWPASEYCFSIPFKNLHELGDIKYVWEINRLQYLQPLSALSLLDADEELARLCFSHIESWINNNPPYKGINWLSGIELSCRLVSMISVFSLLDHDLVPKKLMACINRSLQAHGYWLYRFPSKFSSANNHFIAEAAGLYILSSLAPWLDDSQVWHKYSRKVLIDEVMKQILPDGVGAEQSPTYQAFTLEWLMLCARVGQATSDPFPDRYLERINLAGEYLRWLTDNNGNQPKIGDDDEGHVIFSNDPREKYVTSVLSCISAFSFDESIFPPGFRPHLRNAFLGGSDNEGVKPQQLSGSRCFKSGGYSIYRTGQGERESVIVFDHGPLGYLSIAAHGHADALSVWLSRSGVPVLVDSGTYLYHSGKEWRDYFRGTSAHNTLTLSAINSSQISGPFNWSDKAKSRLLEFRHCGDTRLLVMAEHEGYKKRFGVNHVRKLSMDENEIIIDDWLEGPPGTYAVTIGFTINPEMSIRQDGDQWRVLDQEEVTVLTLASRQPCFAGRIERAQKEPISGWYSPSFGSLLPAGRLVFEGLIDSNEKIQIAITLPG